ncbi:MAG: hypothetical protein AB1762_02545, partial [Gemmatimonadota bacterium]
MISSALGEPHKKLAWQAWDVTVRSVIPPDGNATIVHVLEMRASEQAYKKLLCSTNPDTDVPFDVIPNRRVHSTRAINVA